MSGETLEPDLVTDEDHEVAVQAQDAVLFAQGHERKVLGKMRVRFERGARDAGQKYYFDAERGIVRRRMRETGT